MCATHPLRLFVVADCCCCHRRRRRWSVGARVVGCALRILREEPKTLERERGAPASLGDAHVLRADSGQTVTAVAGPLPRTMEWLYKNAGIGQHSLLLQEPTKGAAVRKGCRVARHAK